MLRTYKKKQEAEGKRNYNDNYLHEAVKQVKAGKMSLRKASEFYAVPYTTLQRWVKDGNKLMKYGRQSVLSDDEEKCLVEGLLVCAKWGFPLQSTDIRIVVQQYLNNKGIVEKRFADNMPGIEWFRSFMQRHNELTVKFSENIKRARAGITKATLESYFENLENSLQGVPLTHIINYDETNFTDDPGAVKVVVKRGVKHPERIIDWSKTSTSVMVAATADGHVLPPYIVYKAKHLYSGWTEGGIIGAAYNRNSSGWFDSNIFYDWFSTIILPYCRRVGGPKLLIGDNLSSHLTLKVIQECEANDIRFVLLPPNSTHLCQPLDVAYFRPLKRAWRKVLDDWKMKNRGPLPKTEFPRVLKSAFERISCSSSENAKAGFQACGIVPFNPQKVLGKLPQNDTTPEEDMKKTLTNSLIEHLQKSRSSETSDRSGRAGAGKRLSIKPGMSVVCKDLTNMQENEEIDDPDSSNENDNEMEVEKEATSCEVQCNEGDHVLVFFNTNKRDRFFVGKILDKKENSEVVVNFLRKKNSKKQVYFVFPDVMDLQTVSIKNIISNVKVRDIRRGRYLISGVSLDNVE